MAAAADKLCGPEGTDPRMTRLPLFGTKIRVAGFGGLRLGEQNALRAIDVFFEEGYLHVNGSWITPRGGPGFRGPVKNHTLHEVPLPRSLMREELLPRVAVLLSLPADAALQRVLNAQEEERQRRASLAQREKDRNLAWWNYPVPPEEELWLFADTVTGLPVNPRCTTSAGTASAAGSTRTSPTTPGPRPSSTATSATTPRPSGSMKSSANRGRSSPDTSVTSSPRSSITTSAPAKTLYAARSASWQADRSHPVGSFMRSPQS